jgi:Rps23 Pro-64 3,4-dihydroxylase Tpa1-like proline 4-hydroxylase
MKIQVVDNFYPADLIQDLDVKSDTYPWTFSRSDSNEDVYWTVQIYGDYYYKTKNLKEENFTKNEVKMLWDYFSSKFKVGFEHLGSCYLNGLTHGIEAHAHIDESSTGHTTVIFYLCDGWNLHWGGETVFFNKEFVKDPTDESYYNNEIIKSVLPRNNRMVLFDSHITHAVRPISITYKGLRKTLMFKLRNISIDELMERHICN